MTIDDAIRTATSEQQVYSLLAAYIDALQSEVKSPQELVRQPVIGLDDVRTRFRQLIAQLDHTATNVNDKRPLMKQALGVYSAALCRLRSLAQGTSDFVDDIQPESRHGSPSQSSS